MARKNQPGNTIARIAGYNPYIAVRSIRASSLPSTVLLIATAPT
jgi:hypothetical protein